LEQLVSVGLELLFVIFRLTALLEKAPFIEPSIPLPPEPSETKNGAHVKALPHYIRKLGELFYKFDIFQSLDFNQFVVRKIPPGHNKLDICFDIEVARIDDYLERKVD